MVVLSDETRPDPEAVRKLFVEYNMTPEGVRQDVAHIRLWMNKQPHLPRIPPSKDDEINYWVEGFLRLTKGSVEKTKIAIDNYFKAKNLLITELLYDVKDFHSYVHSDVFNGFYMMLLPKLTPDGVKIMLYGPTTNDASVFQPTDFFRRMAMVLDIQQKAGIDFTGLRVIIYLRHATLGHLAQFDLPLLKRVFKIAKKAYPIRIRNTHIIHAPGFVEAAVKIIKPFLSKKVMSRITIHKDLESLWEDIPKANLPNNLGGDLPTTQELHEEHEALEFPTEDDGTLLVEKLAKIHPGAICLKYRSNNGRVRIVKEVGGKLFPPDGGWTEGTVYSCVFPSGASSKTGEAESSSSICGEIVYWSTTTGLWRTRIWSRTNPSVRLIKRRNSRNSARTDRSDSCL